MVSFITLLTRGDIAETVSFGLRCVFEGRDRPKGRSDNVPVTKPVRISMHECWPRAFEPYLISDRMAQPVSVTFLLFVGQRIVSDMGNSSGSIW